MQRSLIANWDQMDTNVRECEFARAHLSRIHSVDVWADLLEVSRQHLNRIIMQACRRTASEVISLLREGKVIHGASWRSRYCRRFCYEQYKKTLGPLL